jgi:hypothetical protein
MAFEHCSRIGVSPAAAVARLRLRQPHALSLPEGLSGFGLPFRHLTYGRAARRSLSGREPHGSHAPRAPLAAIPFHVPFLSMLQSLTGKPKAAASRRCWDRGCCRCRRSCHRRSRHRYHHCRHHRCRRSSLRRHRCRHSHHRRHRCRLCRLRLSRSHRHRQRSPPLPSPPLPSPLDSRCCCSCYCHSYHHRSRHRHR